MRTTSRLRKLTMLMMWTVSQITQPMNPEK